MSREQKQSNPEKYFEWYIEELREAGYVAQWTPQPGTWTIFDKAEYEYVKKLKTKKKLIKHGIPGLSKMDYTPDYEVVWAQKAEGVFFQSFEWSFNNDKLTAPFPACPHTTSIIEVKPDFDNRNMTRAVEPKIRMMWQRYGIYVQVIKPNRLFKETFVPQRYLFCDVLTTRARKIDYQARSLREYLANPATKGVNIC